MPRPGHVFGDTSFFFACLEPLDASHPRALELARRVADEGWVVHTTWDVVSETTTLLRYRSSFAAALAFLSNVKPTLRIAAYGIRVRTEAEEIFRQYGRERRLSLCDAISFVVITTLLDGPPCLTFDNDFRALGLDGRQLSCARTTRAASARTASPAARLAGPRGPRHRSSASSPAQPRGPRASATWSVIRKRSAHEPSPARDGA